MKQSIFWRLSLTTVLAVVLLLITALMPTAYATAVSTRHFPQFQSLSPEIWVEIAKITASDAATSDQFGRSVAVSGDTVVAGAFTDDHGAVDAGSVYVFVRPSTGWNVMTETAKLVASDAAPDDLFGLGIAIDGDTIVVGAYQDDDDGESSGSVYVFTRPETGWSGILTETAKLTASDAAVSDQFGYSVDISGDTILVGAWQRNENGVESGAAYLFEQPSGGWVDMTETAKLLPSDGAASDRFGTSVALHGGTAVVGAHFDDDSGNDSGSAYVFERPLGGWANMSETAKLTASDAVASDRFGFAVDIFQQTIVVGAYQDNGVAGSAYIFERPLTGWETMTQTAKLTASDAAATDQFGITVSISDQFILIGANLNDDNGTNSGSAYVFVRPEMGWVNATQTAKLLASDAVFDDQFGRSVAIAEGTVVVGAYRNDDGGTSSGSAYIFETAIVGLTAFNDSPTPLGQITNLTATVSSGSGVVFTWDLGDGATAVGATPSHTYPAIGTYTATVTATNSLSSTAATTTVIITDAPVDGLVVVNDSPTIWGAMTNLTATVTGGTNVTFTWDLGDGTIASGNILSHTYPAIGTYTATVTATNSASQLTGTTVVTITAVPPTGSFIYLPLVVRPFSLQIGRSSPNQPVAQQGNVYYIDTVQIPAQLPTGGQFYLSGSSTEVVPVIVDDRLTLGVNGQAIFTQDFGQPPIGLVIPLEAATVAQMAGQTVTVIYQDVYGDQQGATAVWLIWVP